MHSSLTRAQNVFGFFTTVAFVVAALVAASDYFAARDPSADVKVGTVQVYVLPLLFPFPSPLSTQHRRGLRSQSSLGAFCLP